MEKSSTYIENKTQKAGEVLEARRRRSRKPEVCFPLRKVSGRSEEMAWFANCVLYKHEGLGF